MWRRPTPHYLLLPGETGGVSGCELLARASVPTEEHHHRRGAWIPRSRLWWLLHNISTTCGTCSLWCFWALVYFRTHAKTCKNNSNSSHETLVIRAIPDIMVVSGLSHSAVFFKPALGQKSASANSVICKLRCGQRCVSKEIHRPVLSTWKEKGHFLVVSKRQEKDDFVFFTESANVELIILKKKHIPKQRDFLWGKQRCNHAKH